MATTYQKFENADKYLSLFNELKMNEASMTSLTHFKAASMAQQSPNRWIEKWHERYHEMIKTLGADIDNVL